MKLFPKFKAWVSGPNSEGVLGDGKLRLLDRINTESSLKKATDSLNISYRKAWDDIKKTEKYLGYKLLHRFRGGKLGGKTILTERGKEIIKAYYLFHGELKNIINKSYNKHLKNVLEK